MTTIDFDQTAHRPTNPLPERSILETLLLATRFARREMRAGVRGFVIFLGCLALGVTAIAGVNALSSSLVNSIASEGQSILGGDVRYTLIHREAEPPELAHLESLGDVSVNATMRAMARLPDGSDQALTELKGVDAPYPLYGSLTLEDGSALHDRLAIDETGTYGGVVEAGFLARLNLKIGDEITIGKSRIRVTGVIANEPDRLSSGVGFGPRLMISNEALKASGLVQPGSLVRWHYKIRLEGNPTKADISAIRAASESDFPAAGWQIRARDNASPGLSRNIERFAQFLTLVGLTALIVGGVGVANAVNAYLDQKREVIATFKSIGATGSFVFAVYIIQILMIATIAVIVGLIAGSFVPPLAGAMLVGVLPIPLETSIHTGALLLAAIYGYLMALVFALWPLARARDIPPTALFRDQERVRRLPRPVYLVTLAVLIATLFALAIGLSDNQAVAAYFVGGTIAAFFVLRLIALAIMAGAKRLPHMRSTAARLAIGNIHRPGAITPSVVLSLGLGLTLIVTIALIDHNLRNQLTSSLADEAPNFFFVDIQNHEIDGFESALKANEPDAVIERVPMMRGFFVEIAGKRAEDVKAAPGSQWALRGDRGITYAINIPENSVVVEGEWWDADYNGPPLVSFDEEVARDFGLKVGDTIIVNVLGREIEATVASKRKIEWQSLAINFVMVFSPNTFRGAPHAHLATLTLDGQAAPEREFALMRSVSEDFPTVTTVRVKDALERVAGVVGQLAWAIRGASAVTLLAAILVLAGALAAGHRNQIYDAVVLKTLGATRGELIKSHLIQFATLGMITAVFGILAGTAASWFVIENVMDGTFTFVPSAAFSATAIALALCVGLGMIGTWRILGQKAAPILREL
ncbi:MAG: ABC transporter permease [Pseudomonadota bacterium]